MRFWFSYFNMFGENCGFWTAFFLILLLIHFLLDCIAVHHDTLRYLGLYRLMSYEETKNALGRPERLFGNLIFRNFWKKIIFFLKLQNQNKSYFYAHEVFSSHFGNSKMMIIDFQKVSDFFFLFLIINESLYEPYRQWLGWQFTGGPKSQRLGMRKTIFENFSSIRFVLDSLKVHHDMLRYPGMYRWMLYED